MNRSHRLLRDAHKRRLGRLELASVGGRVDPFLDWPPFQALLVDVRGDRHFDLARLVPSRLSVVDALFEELRPVFLAGGMADDVGRAAAEVAFAGRARVAGRVRLGGGDRGVALGCAALAHAAALERVLLGFGDVMRRRALVDHRDDPCWPDAYVRRRQEAEDERLGIGGPDEPASPNASPAPSQGLGGTVDDASEGGPLVTGSSDDEVDPGDEVDAVLASEEADQGSDAPGPDDPGAALALATAV